MKKRIAIFASGGGSNADKMIGYFKESATAEVVMVLTNNPEAGVIKVARKHHVVSLVFDKQNLKGEELISLLKKLGVDLVVLAGFLWLIPKNLIRAFPERIINIHPALLPEYGGKGMWGHHVHEAVYTNQEKVSGISIHLVNEAYDEGRLLFQKEIDVSKCVSPEDIASKVLMLEHRYFSEVVASYCKTF